MNFVSRRSTVTVMDTALDAPPPVVGDAEPGGRREAGSALRPTAAGTGRIHGIDLARGLAMLGMVIVHYVWATDDVGFGAWLARGLSGRAMPLFVLLGGVGATLVARRVARPDVGLLVRAVLLAAIGLAIEEFDEVFVAIILPFYGLLFVLAPILRRLPSWVLAVSAAGSIAVGGWTYQGVVRRQSVNLDAGREGWEVIPEALFFDGYYPFFPVFGFFALGLIVGRLDLRSERVALWLTGVGLVVGLGVGWASGLVARMLGVDPTLRAEDGSFLWARLLDASGHTSMPAWVISSAGTSMAVLGLSLLVAGRALPWIRPIATLGTMALSFYIFQAMAGLALASPGEVSLGQSWLTAIGLYVYFLILAMIWKRWIPWGPFEALLRIGSGGRQSSKNESGPVRTRPD